MHIHESGVQCEIDFFICPTYTTGGQRGFWVHSENYSFLGHLSQLGTHNLSTVQAHLPRMKIQICRHSFEDFLPNRKSQNLKCPQCSLCLETSVTPYFHLFLHYEGVPKSDCKLRSKCLNRGICNLVIVEKCHKLTFLVNELV